MISRFLILLSLVFVAASLAGADSETKQVAVGDTIPDVSLRTRNDKQVSLRQVVSEKPAIFVFFRGGWCPYCNVHLKALAEIDEDLAGLGVQLIAIGMDQPSVMKDSTRPDSANYRLLSDSNADAARAFGIAFKVDDATIERYKGYRIDLEAASGRDHHLLPHPAIIVADTTGKIRFVHVNPDYKERMEPSKVLEAAKLVATKAE